MSVDLGVHCSVGDEYIEFSNALFRHLADSALFFDAGLMMLLKNTLHIEKTQLLFYDNAYRLQNFYSMTRAGAPSLFTQGCYHQFYLRNPIYHKILSLARGDHRGPHAPHLCVSTDIIPEGYDSSEFAVFLQKNFDGMKYAIVVPFGQLKRLRLTFMKSSEEGDFTERERQTVQMICSTIDAAYRAFLSRYHSQRDSAIKSRLLAAKDTGLLVLDGQMRTLFCNSVMENYLASMLRDDSPASRLALVSACLQDPAGEHGCLAGGRPCRLTVSLEMDGFPYESEPNYYITMTPVAPEDAPAALPARGALQDKMDPGSPGLFGPEEAGLSSREREVAAEIASGKSYRDIAGQMYLSENTVRKHAQNIFKKLGVRNRTQLMYRSLGIGPGRS